MKVTEEQIAAMISKAKACIQRVEYLKGAVDHLNAALFYAKAPQGVDAQGEAFWMKIQKHLQNLQAAAAGSKEAATWLIENCPAEVTTFGGDGSFMEQARARLTRVVEQSKAPIAE